MKRFIVGILIILLFVCGCTAEPIKEEVASGGRNTGVLSSGIWLSYSEISTMLTSQKGFEKEVEEAVENCKALKIENIYIHVRPFCDSIFPSELFPLRSEAEAIGYDVFDYMLSAFHSSGIKVHAWINPYRVYTASSDINLLNTKSPAYSWLNDENEENDKNVLLCNGIYLNPAEAQVRQLVIDGIREIIEKYSVDGIHFDDYFYPSTNAELDAESYKIYAEKASKPLSLEDWRRTNVNTLISGCATAIRNSGKDIVFSISPTASIEKNYNELYADVEYWIKNGMVDAIIPQIYFGFEYPQKEFGFEELFKEWSELVGPQSEIELIIGLATYKIGTDTQPDSIEWQRDGDIIARQVKLCREDSIVSGYVLFSYSSAFGSGELNRKQREALTEYINTY